jgi:hypothetical protein
VFDGRRNWITVAEMKPIGFTKSNVDLSAEKWEDVERYNATLGRLINRRKGEVLASGPFATSKTAGKCAVLQQALLTGLRCWPLETPGCGTTVTLFAQFWRRVAYLRLLPYVTMFAHV